jgi:hypothetical protein
MSATPDSSQYGPLRSGPKPRDLTGKENPATPRFSRRGVQVALALAGLAVIYAIWATRAPIPEGKYKGVKIPRTPSVKNVERAWSRTADPGAGTATAARK